MSTHGHHMQRRAIALLALLAGVVSWSAAEAQQMRIIKECRKAQLLRSVGKHAEAVEWQRKCDVQRRAAPPPAPPPPRHTTPRPRPAVTSPTPPIRRPTAVPPRPTASQPRWTPPRPVRPVPYPPSRPTGFAPRPTHAAAPWAPAPAPAPAPAAPRGYFAPAPAPPYAPPPAAIPAPTPPAPALARLPSLERDRAAATNGGVDVTVFGIRLGDAFGLPACTTAAQLPGGIGPDQPCVVSRPIGTLIAASAGQRVKHPQGVAEFAVRLPAARCPDWLRAGRVECTLFVATQGGHVIATTFPVGGEPHQDAIEATLTQKYGRAPAKDKVSECRRSDTGVTTQRAAVRLWSMPGLRVSYDPLGAACAQSQSQGGVGRLEILTDTYVNLAEQNARSMQANQPM